MLAPGPHWPHFEDSVVGAGGCRLHGMNLEQLCRHRMLCWTAAPWSAQDSLRICPKQPANSSGHRGVILEALQAAGTSWDPVALCDRMDCSTPGLPVHHQHPELAQTHVHRHPTISSSAVPFSFCLQSFPASRSFPMSQYFVSGAKVLDLELQHQSFQ